MPSATKEPVCPVADTDCAVGVRVSAVKSAVFTPFVTVNVALLVTADVPDAGEMGYVAVMVVVPWPFAVAKPVWSMLATCELLEPHETDVVSYTVEPEAVVPIAMKFVVWPGAATD